MSTKTFSAGSFAKRVRVTKQTVVNWIAAGKIAAVRIQAASANPCGAKYSIPETQVQIGFLLKKQGRNKARMGWVKKKREREAAEQAAEQVK